MCLTFNCIAQWMPSSNGNNSQMTSCFVESSGVLLCGTFNGIFASTDYGSTWSPSESGTVAGSGVTCLGKNSAGLFAGKDGFIYFSANNGAFWTALNSNGNGVNDLAFFTDTIFAASFGVGVIRSINNGLNWTIVNNGLTTNKITKIIRKGNLIFVGTYGDGIFVSTDYGANWIPVNTGIVSPVYIFCLETDGTNLYAGTSHDFLPNIPAHGMYISSNNGSSWTQVTNGIADSIDVYAIKSIGNVLLSSTHDIHRSTDHGLTWTSFMNGISPTLNLGATTFYETASYVFAGFEEMGTVSIFRIDKSEVVSVHESPEQNITCSVFPNPCDNELNIQNNSTQQIQFTLYNLLGQKLMEKFLTDKISTINISALSNGLYFYQVSDEHNLIINGKIIKK